MGCGITDVRRWWRVGGENVSRIAASRKEGRTLVGTKEGNPRDKSRREKVRGVQLGWKSSF